MDRRWFAGVALAALVGAVPVARAGDDDGGDARPRLRVHGEGDRPVELYLGEDRISLDEFLSRTGHADRAHRIATRRKLRIGLIGGGAAVLLTGVGLALWGETCDSTHDVTGDCVGRKTRMHGIALVVVLVGAGGVVLGRELSSLRPSRGELEAMAWDYDNHGGGAGTGSADVRTRVIPYVDPHGGGVALARAW